MSKNNENSKPTLLEFLSVKAELASDALAGEMRIELRGRNLLFVQGCRRILKYTPKFISLEVKNDSILIGGERLVCTSYHAGGVSVEGRISSISFADGRDSI